MTGTQGREAAELVGEARQLIEEAERRGARLRLLGGIACWLMAPRGRELTGLRRSYGDLDFVVNRRGAGVLPAAFSAVGWEDDRFFNARHGASRLLFHRGDLQADVFVGTFEQCHRLDLDGRLTLAPLTLSLADLLLTKLQVRQLNVKDVQDALALLVDHDLGLDGGPEGEELARIRRILRADWGWYATVTDNLAALDALADRYLEGDDLVAVRRRLRALTADLAAQPKSLGWRLRSVVGRRWPWYEEPEEVLR
jgi:hypothetical protein